MALEMLRPASLWMCRAARSIGSMYIIRRSPARVYAVIERESGTERSVFGSIYDTLKPEPDRVLHAHGGTAYWT